MTLGQPGLTALCLGVSGNLYRLYRYWTLLAQPQPAAAIGQAHRDVGAAAGDPCRTRTSNSCRAKPPMAAPSGSGVSALGVSRQLGQPIHQAEFGEPYQGGFQVGAALWAGIGEQGRYGGGLGGSQLLQQGQGLSWGAAQARI